MKVELASLFSMVFYMPLKFEKLSDDTSKLTMQVVYKSVSLRDQMLKLPFAQGINMAHKRMEEIMLKLK